MKATAVLALAVIATTGCAPDTSAPNFGHGGSNPQNGQDGGGGSDAPTITSLTVVFDDYPNIGKVLEVEIAYTDPQDDVDGGEVDATVSSDAGDSQDLTLPIDGSSAWIDDQSGDVIFALEGVDTSTTYHVSLRLCDAAGNCSAESEADSQ